MPSEIELYYWPTANGRKISIALEEMGLPYRVIPVNINRGEQYDPAFLTISPNNRIPAIVDPDGPDGKPISVFETGAILLYLSRKTGSFGGSTERDRVAVEQWLMWQMGGVGPMAGQANHFLRTAPRFDPPQVIPYAQERYSREVARLYGVLDRRLADNAFVAGDFYSVADMAIWPWANGWERQQQTLDDKPHFARWLADIRERPPVQRALALAAEMRSDKPRDARAMEVLYGLRRA